MSQPRESPDDLDDCQEIVSLETSINTNELMRSEVDIEICSSEAQPPECSLTIVPNSAISLTPKSVKNKQAMDIEPSSTSRWRVIDSWDNEIEVPSPAAQKGALTNEQDLNEDIICLDDNEEERITGRENGGGFVINGTVEFDRSSINSDKYKTMDSEDENEIIYAPPQIHIDDSIVFDGVVQDGGLVPRVFSGYVKEFIDDKPNRLGILFSQDCGR